MGLENGNLEVSTESYNSITNAAGQPRPPPRTRPQQPPPQPRNVISHGKIIKIIFKIMYTHWYILTTHAYKSVTVSAAGI